MNVISVGILLAFGASALSCVLAFVAIGRLSRLERGGASSDLADKIGAKVDSLAALFVEAARKDREELGRLQAAFSEAQTTQLSAMRKEATDGREALEAAQKRQLDTYSETVTKRMGETQQALKELSDRLEKAQAEMRKEAADGREALEAAQKRQLETYSDTVTKRMGETQQALKELAERLEKAHAELKKDQKEGLTAVETKVKELTEANQKKQDELREALNKNLKELREENEKKLDEMRKTVDEKLHDTLEKRLGDSFKLVSERLEQVHLGLGEMKNLATGVGDLKRVLTNVKSRGAWGEVQLGMLLEDMLTIEQYAKNVRIRPDSGEIVEFAVRLPGGVEDGPPLFLPIDCKFPQEDYERLVVAQEAGLPEEVERWGAALERAVRTQAKLICEKYVHPPYSTDFAIMYLPTEGLFAEVVRRPGLAADIQAKHRVILTGPTTLAALLSSLQMGSRTLAIAKRSSEVWQVLGAAKAEFQKYGEVWEKLGKQLETAQNTVASAGRRTRAIQRSLRGVEALDGPVAEALLLAADFDDAAEEA